MKNKIFLTFLGLFAFGMGGVAMAAVRPPADNCRDLANVSGQAMRINTEIMTATTEFLNADSANDAAGMVASSTKLTRAVNDLNALKSQYSAADSKCNV